MSHSRKSMHEMGFGDALANRFRDSLACSGGGGEDKDKDKPDFKELDLGSPTSPLVNPSSVDGVLIGGSGATSSTSSSSSSGSVCGKNKATQLEKRSEASGKSHSGELYGPTQTSPRAAETLRSASTAKPGHRRSVSAGPPLIYSGKTFAVGPGTNANFCSNPNSGGATSNPTANVLPSGNICPSGKIQKSTMAYRAGTRTDVLGKGTGYYGHGNIMRGGNSGGVKLSSQGNAAADSIGNIQTAGASVIVKRAMLSSDPEEVKRAGNELYRRGIFTEALSLYNRAISMWPENVAYRSNRAAALTAMGRLGEAVKECEEAVKLDPSYARAHQRLTSLFLRLGQVEDARRHLYILGQQADANELQKLQSLEKHLKRCAEARNVDDWKSALRESDAAIAVGADSCPQLLAFKAEALLRLHQLKDAESCLSNIPKFELYSPSCSKAKFLNMLAEAFVLYVHAQVEMALGRFQNAVAAAEKAAKIDYNNVEIEILLNKVKMVARARDHGNDLFSAGRYAEACTAYGEGLKYDSFNSVLYCNRAVCWSKLGQWEQSIDDCNQALRIQPNYSKALLRRAVSNEKLGRWAEVVRDYETLRKELPGDNEVAESLLRAQVALKKSRGVEVHSRNYGAEVEEVSSLQKFKAAISSPAVSVVYFKVASNEQCEAISPFVNVLCDRYPSVHFFKVDVEESMAVARAESIRTVPTFKIYKNGEKVKEMVCPSHKVLEDSVRNCCP